MAKHDSELVAQVMAEVVADAFDSFIPKGDEEISAVVGWAELNIDGFTSRDMQFYYDGTHVGGWLRAKGVDELYLVFNWNTIALLTQYKKATEF